MLSQVKLIAEPWDVGPGGYQVGNFPVLWTEWNGLYRDTVRDFWRGAGVASASSRSASPGSSDLYRTTAASPFASINFVTAHDGFTLADLVSYNEKHNDANGEENRDGTDDNRSLELRRRGPDRRPGDQRAPRPPAAQLPRDAVPLAGRADAARRRRDRPHPGRQQQRAGARTTSSPGSTGSTTTTAELLDFTRRLIALRRAHPVFRRARFLTGVEPRRLGRCRTSGGSARTAGA